MQQVLRTRYVDAGTGRMLALGSETASDPFWAEVYDGRFGHLVFGHSPFLDGPAHFAFATGIDTGCVHGGALTAMLIAADGERSFVSVPGRRCAPLR